jgi:uncharacterized lipoprotein YajG
MKTSLFMAAAALLLAACEDHASGPIPEPVEIKANMPAGLKDCRVFRVATDVQLTMIITRCPHSETATRSGKYNNSVTAEVPEEEEAP